jgi:hypothetical protein
MQRTFHVLFFYVECCMLELVAVTILVFDMKNRNFKTVISRVFEVGIL